MVADPLGTKQTPRPGRQAGGMALGSFALLLAAGVAGLPASWAASSPPHRTGAFAAAIRPFLRTYCLSCHSTQARRAGLDLERFTTPESLRRDLKPWQGVIDHLEVGDMPPHGSPQPSDAEKDRVVTWVRTFLAAEARTSAGDPGDVPVRRLSNTEYNNTIRDLTGVDLQPAREFPVDGAAGEGFTNAAESLTDISPTLLAKYLAAAREISEHAVLLPDGFRFAAGKTRRDWTDESTARLRAFYSTWTNPEGRLDFTPYLAATVRRRSDLASGGLEAVAKQEKLNPKYLGTLWKTLTEPRSDAPLNTIQAVWRTASERDVPALAARIASWQEKLWQVVRVGSYVRPVGKEFAESLTRQIPTDAPEFKAGVEGCDRFRDCFPRFLCFPNVIPNDEVVSLKMFHREDEPLKRLFLYPAQARELDRLWSEHLFISRQAAAEKRYLPLFIGFVTQDQPKEMVAFFEGQRPAFDRRAAELQRWEEEAIPGQLAALTDFTSRAYRRPLTAKERTEQATLYRSLRAGGSSHEEAVRALIARILVAPAFLFRIEQPPSGPKPAPISDWELATRLSYFLWASPPDAELRRLAAAGSLHRPEVLQAQTRRMLKDDRVRSMAVEFGAQWLHVRGFDALNEKNERLFPTFDADLRGAIYEETIRFFQDLFQSDRPATAILNADYTYLNESLARHYGIPGVVGNEWRRVEHVQRYGRGGVLGLASVQAAQSGASRTSPVLRGNWVSETLLGERLPRPPANVPKLPEEESTAGLTIRQQVESHSRNPACAVCHRRIDPFGFAFERYDPIGRYRDRDLGGRPIDAHATLRDGTKFEGLDGLRRYLMTTRRHQVMRLFFRRLLGYALGRTVANSDQPLLDTMMARLNRNGKREESRISEAILAIVTSPQFQRVRGNLTSGG